MRQKLNENPLTQAIAIGLLAVVVGFLLLTRMGGGASSSSATTTSPTAGPAASSALPAAPGATSSESTLGASPDVAPGAAPTAAATSDFKAGPGLPQGVADAYADGKVVVLLVIREHPQGCYSDFVGGQCAGLDDRKLDTIVQLLRLRPDTAVFVTHAYGIGRYSRIAQGVDVDRVPALIVVKPKRLAEGPLPEATVSYGFRDPQTVEQAVRDALYTGRDDLPYYPQ